MADWNQVYKAIKGMTAEETQQRSRLVPTVLLYCYETKDYPESGRSSSHFISDVSDVFLVPVGIILLPMTSLVDQPNWPGKSFQPPRIHRLCEDAPFVGFVTTL